MASETRQRWLLMIYRVPQEPPGRRTYVWRHLKQLGAVYLQQAAAILPDRPDRRRGLETLAAWIRDVQGEVSLLETASPDADWEQDLIHRFQQASDAEYSELVETVERFEDEIRRESRKGKFTFAELAELEADWDKLQRWRGQIHARDGFAAPGRQDSETALDRGRLALDAFAATVEAHEQQADHEEDAHVQQ